MPEALPKTLEEAVSNIVESLDGESRQKLLGCDIRDLYEFHGVWGMGIRNDFKLFGNTDLLSDCGSPRMHADDASMVIMQAVWYQIHDLPISKARVENYRRIEDVVREMGIEKFYLSFRTNRSGKRKKDQEIYKMMKMFFKINFKDYKPVSYTHLTLPTKA